MSVTDLVSPAWCELQYWYTLSKYGRKPATAAMRRGTSAHQVLEEQVHETVPVRVLTREDGWALRLWNVIQALATLRATGIAREIEVWGVVDGLLVTGIIDQLSYHCPDDALEQYVQMHGGNTETPQPPLRRARRSSQSQHATTLTQYLLSSAAGGRRLEDCGIAAASFAETETGRRTGTAATTTTTATETLPKIYITDIKSRSSGRSVPAASSSGFLPTRLQLSLYHQLLTCLILGKEGPSSGQGANIPGDGHGNGERTLDGQDDQVLAAIVERHGLQPDQPFSDAFLAEMSQLPLFAESGTVNLGHVSTSQPSSSSLGADADALDVVLAHNNLNDLWRFLKQQLRLTFLEPDPPQGPPAQPQQSQIPHGSRPVRTRLSPILTATYISAQRRSEPKSKSKSKSKPKSPLPNPVPATTATDAADASTSPSASTSVETVEQKKECEEGPAKEEIQQGNDDDDQQLTHLGSRSFVADPAVLHRHVVDTLRFWRGHRRPCGVAVFDAWKCRICDFADSCDWRAEREREAIERAERRARARSWGCKCGDGDAHVDADVDADVDGTDRDAERDGEPHARLGE